LSEDSTPPKDSRSSGETHRSGGSRIHGTASLRNRKSFASLRMKQDALRHHAKRAHDEERWIALLERQNEELLAQITYLTKDLSQSDRRHKMLVRREQDEVAHLQYERREWYALRISYAAANSRTTALTEQSEAHSRERAAFRNQLVELRIDASKKENEYQARLSALHQDLATLARDKEAATARAKRCEQELQLAKRRNASLAEELLAKKTLELTVEGQQRYLLELSSALDRMQEEQALGSPVPSHRIEQEEMSSRPSSMDGHALTQEVLASLASTGSSSRTRRLSRDSPLSLKRMFLDRSEGVSLPPSPPATTCADQESVYSPLSPRVCVNQLQVGAPRHRRSTSLWAELNAVPDMPTEERTTQHSRPTTSETTVSSTSATGVQPIQLYVLLGPLAHLRGMALERATRALILLTAWCRFILILVAAFLFAVYEGPAGWRPGAITAEQ
jgi:hypothetical protein